MPIDINALRAKRAEIVTGLETLNKSADGRALTTGEAGNWKILEKAVAELDEQISRSETLEKARASSLRPVAHPFGAAAQTVYASPRHQELAKGDIIGRITRAVCMGKGDFGRTLDFAKSTNDDELCKALTAGTPTGGGFMIDPVISDDFIELLRAKAVMRNAIGATLPMPNGSLTMRRQTSGVTASYIGESKAISKSQPAVGLITLTAKKLAVMVPVSNDLLRYAGPRTDAMIRDSLIRDMALREDLAFIRGDGTSDTPRGLYSFATEASTTFAANGTVNLANIDADINSAILKLVNSNVAMNRPAWVMAPRTKVYLGALRTTQGPLAYAEVTASNTLRGFPIITTTQIPINLGSGADESEIYLVDLDSVLLADVNQIEISMSQDASYYDGSNWNSAFESDLTLVRAIGRHDLNMRHIEAVTVLTGVKWY